MLAHAVYKSHQFPDMVVFSHYLRFEFNHLLHQHLIEIILSFFIFTLAGCLILLRYCFCQICFQCYNLLLKLAIISREFLYLVFCFLLHYAQFFKLSSQSLYFTLSKGQLLCFIVNYIVELFYAFFPLVQLFLFFVKFRLYFLAFLLPLDQLLNFYGESLHFALTELQLFLFVANEVVQFLY